MTIKVLVLRRLPESSFTEIFVMSLTYCFCSSERISCLSQFRSSLQRITPLEVFRDLCGVTRIGHPARCGEIGHIQRNCREKMTPKEPETLVKGSLRRAHPVSYTHLTLPTNREV